MRREMAKQNKTKMEKVPTYNMNIDQIKAMKDESTEKAVDIAFKLLLCIPVMVIHDHYADLMRKEVGGKSRGERLADMILDLYDSYEKGYVTLDELEQCLWEEAGIKFDKEIKK